jgi:hypothetical protein
VSAETPAPPRGSDETSDERSSERREQRRLDPKTILPILTILVLVVVPIAIWAATSGGGKNNLRIDQGVSVYGEPEIVVNVPKKLNTPGEATNSTSVKLICVDASGKTVLATAQYWPFINESGYPYPHIHQPVTPKQLQEIARCRLEGTKTKLEGALRRT